VFDKFVPFAKTKGVATWNDVTSRLLNSYATYLEELEYYGKTIRNELTTLVQACKWLSEEGYLPGIERPRVKLRKVESQRAYCYRPVEVEAMIKRCRETEGLAWLADVIVALACTGLRIAELAGLRWSDIDLAKGLLTLTDETGRGGKPSGRKRELKSGRSRSIPIHPELADVFRRLRRVDQHVFRGPRGGRIKPDTVRNILIREVIQPLTATFKDEAAEQSFEHGRVHSFRHYFASMCANRGVPERIVMEWLGHKDSEMVRHYYHLHDDESRQQMAKLDLLENKTGKRPPGPNGAANSQPEESPSRKGKPKKRGKGN
jgi:integrase